jgi:hypothetical protein
MPRQDQEFLTNHNLAPALWQPCVAPPNLLGPLRPQKTKLTLAKQEAHLILMTDKACQSSFHSRRAKTINNAASIHSVSLGLQSQVSANSWRRLPHRYQLSPFLPCSRWKPDDTGVQASPRWTNADGPASRTPTLDRKHGLERCFFTKRFSIASCSTPICLSSLEQLSSFDPSYSSSSCAKTKELSSQADLAPAFGQTSS